MSVWVTANLIAGKETPSNHWAVRCEEPTEAARVIKNGGVAWLPYSPWGHPVLRVLRLLDHTVEDAMAVIHMATTGEAITDCTVCVGRKA